jgi:hypothetical protein
MRITDQYFWNIIFLVFFVCVVFMATIILQSEAVKPYAELTLLDLTLITLASFRIVRAVIYDKIFAFLREQFYDATEQKGKVLLMKPDSGPRRTIADLLSCPWCFGVWATFMVSFFYLLTPYAFFPILFLALSSVASFLQILSNLIGWKAEGLLCHHRLSHTHRTTCTTRVLTPCLLVSEVF